jgi:hypothetical protein
MSENRTIHLVEIPIGGSEGAMWNHLHGEREQICEALLKCSEEEKKSLQRCLRKIDDTLDRLMSGASQGRGAGEDIALDSLNAFDTIILRTHNSDYRILLLDPKTGRALVEGGEYLAEPKEALLKGSAMQGSEFKSGSICVGSRLEMWVDERALLTSPIKSIQVKHSAVADLSATMH